MLRFVKVTVNVFWMKTSIFRIFHIQIAELSRHTMVSKIETNRNLENGKNPM